MSTPKARDPTDAILTRASFWYAVRRAAREFSRDQLIDKAAALTYYSVLSIFPALIALVSLLGVVGQAEATTNRILDLLDQLLPATVTHLLAGPISSVVGSTGAGWGLVLGLVTALWTASNYVNAFSRAVNGVYEVREGRPFWKLRPMMYAVTVLLVVLVAVAALLLVLTGPVAVAIGDLVGLGHTALTVWGIAKWPVLLVIASIVIATLYYFTPNVRQPKFRWISPGAVAALIVAGIATAGLGLYVANVANYDATYGALAGVAIFLLWLWVMNLVILFGVELDVELERARELQRGMPAAAGRIQLPLRDTSKIVKDAQRYQELVDAGEVLAEHAADPLG